MIRLWDVVLDVISVRRRHTIYALVAVVPTCARPIFARTARLTGHAIDVDRKNIVGRFRIHDRGDRMLRYRWGALRRQRKNSSGFEEHVPAPGQLRG